MSRLFDDASNQYLDRTEALLTAEPITLACWFNSNDTTVNQTLVSIGTSGATPGFFRLAAMGGVTGDPVRAQKQQESTPVTNQADTSVGYSSNTWHHAAAVFASTESRTVYIDGGNSNNNTSLVESANPNRTDVGVLQGSTGLTQYMSGRIAEVGIWNAALSASEIKSLSAGYSPLLVRPQNLVAYWPLFARATDEEDWAGGNALTNINGASRAAHPPRIIYPARSWTPIVIQGGAGATVSVGLASELSTAFAISRLKQKAVGLSTETDTALATAPAKVTAVGLSTETDTAFSILRSKIKAAGLSIETDSAFALIISSTVNVGLSTEADAALSAGRGKIKIAGLGIETDVAFTVSRLKLKELGLSTELDQALAISSSGSLAVGLASELDVALVIGRLKQQVLGLPTETDLSQPISKSKTQQAGLSVESDAALAVTGSSGLAVGLATETDLAQSASSIKQRLIGLAPETDVALAITIAGVTVVINTNAKETLKLLAENPTLTLSAENATLTLT